MSLNCLIFCKTPVKIHMDSPLHTTISGYWDNCELRGKEAKTCVNAKEMLIYLISDVEKGRVV